ncbi:hypothetical protein LTR91_011283 [Friedmanniomyces endolithicus]|uniref:Transcription factor domain-containing protein n=2 Tax=Friedmanniomyces endolithicus TaxID=329885 RepID=A0AAN6KHU8_9PEZI|nr:37S ribosomal protein S22 [Friedmanniomyces endolithicus]KAK0295934.1 37S ribosomal protein S22 [Friedmanniomyces endolithicus]KAK0914912.1 hypothetical protein LTR57_013711 [Friedmanniomyces endolithicus]KAK0979870.1 hypothetical protein LTS01_012238 [Friedmanniomyces endolithicus]KAK0983340.1 hypothetical protein LTR91_011283 [Friedmanniomyces endolithicus]
MYPRTYQPTLTVSDNVKEQRSFHYFHICVAQETFGSVQTAPWYELVLQASQSVPIVQHAVFALGFLLQAREADAKARLLTCATTSQVSEDLMRSSLLQYTKAMSLLSSETSCSQASQRSALIVCPLFVWIEILNRRLDPALQHLKGGLSILNSFNSAPSEPRIASSLRDMYARLHAQARFHGSPTSDFNTQAMNVRVGSPGTLSGPFADLAEARRYLDGIAEALYLEVRNIHTSTGNSKIERSSIDGTAGEDDSSLFDMLRISLTKWHARFVTLTNDSTSGRPSPASSAEAMLLLQHLSLNMIIEGVLCKSEMAYDQHTATFERMLSLAERILRTNRPSGLAVLPLDSGVIAPLFMIALKCRDIVVRWKAVALLELAPEQECMWRRDDVIAFARWKFRKEGHENPPTGDGLYSEVVPLADAARSHSERSSTQFVGGRAVTVLHFKVGESAADGSSVFESEITDLSADMGDIL